MGSESKNEGVEGISPKTKKVVQSLKEIVKHCTDQEIYGILRECNMDPNEAAQLLLSQDTFHEVKSKRERRKEMKDTQESWSRGNNGGLNRGVRGNNGTRNVGRSGPTQISYNELGKAAYDGEKGSVASSFSSSITHAEGKTMNQQTLLHSDSFSTDSRRQSIGTGDPISASAQLSTGFQSAWLGATIVRPSMADILKMGRPQNKGSQTLTIPSCTPQDAVTPNSSLYCAKSSHVSATLQQEWHQDLHPQDLSNMLEAINESGASARQHVLNDECPVIEEPTANSGSSVADAPAASEAEISCNQSNSQDNGASIFRNCVSDVVRVLKRDFSENLSFDAVRCASASSRQIIMNNAVGASDCDNFLLKDISSNGSYMAFELQEAPLSDDTNEDVSSTTATLYQLSLRNEEPAVPTTEDNCALVLPSHLQALAADCSQLSFGTYKASSNSSFSEPLGSNPSKFDWGKASVAIDGSYGHLDSRNSGHTGDEQLRSMYNTFTGAADARNYDLTASSQSKLMKHTIPEATVGHEFVTKALLSDSDFNNSQQPTSAFSFARADSQIRNLPAFSSELHSYSDTMRSDLFTSTIKSLRDSDDHLHSSFPVTPSIPSISKSDGSPLSGSTNSMLKVLNPTAFSNVQSSSVHPHHLYQPQANLTLEQLANGTRYPSVARSQAYMTSTMDRGYPGNGASSQSLAGTNYSLPQYNSGPLSSRLPNPASNASGYGSFGTHTNSGRFLHNPSTDLTISHGGYDDILHSNYMGGNNFTPYQQDDGFSAWNYGPGSRTMSSVPDSTYYSLAERNQQINRYLLSQQNSQYHAAPGQQNSQRHGPPGYPDYSHS